MLGCFLCFYEVTFAYCSSRRKRDKIYFCILFRNVSFFSQHAVQRCGILFYQIWSHNISTDAPRSLQYYCQYSPPTFYIDGCIYKFLITIFSSNYPEAAPVHAHIYRNLKYCPFTEPIWTPPPFGLETLQGAQSFKSGLNEKPSQTQTICWPRSLLSAAGGHPI